MAYVIIALAVLFIVAPIVAILPNATQKAQMRYRKAARDAGCTVGFETITDPDPQPGEYVTITGKPVAPEMRTVVYRLPRKRPNDWRRLPEPVWAIVRRAPGAGDSLPEGFEFDGPPSIDPGPELLEIFQRDLPRMPEDVVRLDEHGWMLSVYWHERGGDEGVTRVIDWLRSCAGASIPALNPVDESDQSFNDG